MEGLRDQAEDALRRAATPAYERIRRDLEIEGLPDPVRRFLAYYREHLFDPDLNVSAARRELEIRDNSVSTEFGSWLGCTPSHYLRQRRLETAARMLAETDLEEQRIGRAVGFNRYETFYKLYKSWTGMAPSRDRDDPASPLDLPSWHRVFRGELAPEEAEQLLAELHRVYPEAAAAAGGVDVPLQKTVVDGAEYERYHAEHLWEGIRGLAFEDQQRQVRGYLFQSTVLFDLLREKSREVGHRDRTLGIRIAELALGSLDGHEAVFGDKIHDLRALGWAWLADARRLAGDFEGAEADFAQSDQQWAAVRATKNLEALATIQLLKGELRVAQRRYPEALELLNESLRLSRLDADSEVRAHALVRRASAGQNLDTAKPLD